MEPAIVCKILDISYTGAKLIFWPENPLPDTFVLHTGYTKHYAKVVWRRKNQVGVEFETLTRPYRESGKLPGSDKAGK